MKYRILPGWKELRDYDLKKSRRELERSYSGSIETPFEGRIVGGTPRNHAYLHERGNTLDDYHTPMTVVGEGKLPKENASIEEANFLRKRIGFVHYSAFSLGYLYDPKSEKLKEDKDLDMSSFLAVSLEHLDPQTGVTIRDPRILGVWDKATDTYREIPGRDLTREFYQKLKLIHETSDEPSRSTWNYVRDGKSYLETETPASPEKK